MVLLGLSSDSNSALRGTLSLTSLALVSTIAFFSLKAELSLHHAMASITLLSITMLPLHLVESWRITSPGLFIAQQLRLGIYAATQLWLVIKTPCLGSHPECNFCTQTVMFFTAYPAVNNFGRSARAFGILVVGFTWMNTTLYTYGLAHYIDAVPAMLSASRAARWAAFAENTLEDITAWRVNEVRRCQQAWASERRRRDPRQAPAWVGIVPKLFLWYQDTTAVKSVVDKHQWSQALRIGSGPGWRERVWLDLRLACKAPRFHRMVISLLLAVVWISSTEYSISINLTDGANKWGFGQIFSMVAAAPFVTTLVKLVLRLGAREK